MLLSLAGIDRETIYADYLLTNEYSRENREATLASYPPAIAEIFRPANMAERDYLKAGLGQSPQTIAALGAKLLR
ncbi:tyrosine-protein phosphatase [Tomitella biformata]|uniref:tyrosine-protein phosphatase n=1 Tax=Tomitella biformata TaxID=630403 RepID=UPI000466C824|nr:tyrosine-protein phosphatase [Tomitella biformata]